MAPTKQQLEQKYLYKFPDALEPIKPVRIMNNSILDELQRELEGKNLVLGTRKATEWMLDKLKVLTTYRYVNRGALMKDEERLEPRTFLGGMFFFYYDPKHKLTLPYYDRFPLVIPIDFYNDGFLGLNLHYLFPRDRVMLLNRLSQYTNNMRYDETTKFKLTYELLKGTQNLEAFKPCIKRYLGGHVRSQFLRIDGHEWHIACVLPVDKFVKESKETVWSESRKKYRKRR